MHIASRLLIVQVVHIVIKQCCGWECSQCQLANTGSQVGEAPSCPCQKLGSIGEAGTHAWLLFR